MSLLDNLMGALGKKKSGEFDIISLISWIMNQGGIEQIIAKFTQGGLGDIIQSWISGNVKSFLPVSTDQIQSIFGQNSISELASSLNLDQNKTSSLLSEYLPQAVNLISSKGENFNLEDLISNSSGLLKNLFK